MIDITTVLNAESISEFINGLPLVHTVGKVIFPAKKQMGIDITMIKGALNKPIVLKPSQFDTSVRVRSLRADITQETKEIPFFKEAVVIKEKDRQNLLMAMSAANVQWRNLILDNVYGNISGLVDGADVQAERMRMQLLAQGAINIVTADGDIVLDYGHPVSNKETLTGTAKWSDTTNSNPVDDIGRWQDLVEIATGVRPSRAICSRTTFRFIQKNQKIRLDVNYNGSTIITETIIKQYLLAKVGVSLEIIAGTFLAEDGITELTYYPEGKLTLFPEGNLGNTYYGTTPEEADLITGNAADVKIVKEGIAITTVKKTDPVTILTKVSQICLPSFEKVLQVFIATI